MPAEIAPIVPNPAPARSVRTSSIVLMVLACVGGALLLAGAAFLVLFLFLGVRTEGVVAPSSTSAEEAAPASGR